MSSPNLPVNRGKYIALIDEADYERVRPYGWCLNADGYIVARINNHIVELSRFILGAPPEARVIYLNDDKLDNRRANLLLTDHSLSTQRQKRHHIGSSQYRGVQYHPRTKRWKAMIMARQKVIHLGYFDEEIDAARAYDQAALEHFGEHARLNFPIDNLASASQLNRRERPRTSQYRGVGQAKASGRWRASIYVNRQRIHLGYYATELAAAQAYDEAALTYYGAQAILNFPAYNSSEK